MSKWLQCRQRSPQSTPPARPQCVYRFVIWLSAFSTQKKKKDSAKTRELRAVSVTTPIHSLTRCLHAHRARQDAIGPRSDCWSCCWSRARRRSCHWHIVHRRLCLYAGALIAARLHFVWGRAENLDSRSKPSGVVTPAPACSLSCLCLSSTTNEKQRFNNFALEILFERISCQAISGHICVTSAAIEPGRERDRTLSVIRTVIVGDLGKCVVALTMN